MQDTPLSACAATLDVERDLNESDAKVEFMARMSHELRTPLNAVLGFAHVLLNDTTHRPSAWQRERMQHVEAAGRQLLAMVDQLLLLTANASLAETIDLQPVALAQAVALAWQSRAWAAPQGSLGTAMAPVGRVLADPIALQRVLQLLLSALDQDAGGREPPHCSALAEWRGGQAGWRLRMQRLAGHAEPQVQASLFDAAPSAQAAALRDEGLNLVAAAQLLARMGGELVPVPSDASQISLWLPSAEAKQTTIEARPQPVTDNADMAEPLRLLCVEDNPVNMLLLQELLAQRPAIRLCACTTGGEAVAQGLNFRPQVALLDLHLPDISGFEVMHALRREPQLADCRFIALSANALLEDIRSARQAGFDDYWTKPIDVPDFMAALDGLIAAPRSF